MPTPNRFVPDLCKSFVIVRDPILPNQDIFVRDHTVVRDPILLNQDVRTNNRNLFLFAHY